MNTLVLGGNGFIGSHLIDRLLREKHAVSVFDRQPELFRKPIDGVRYCYADFGNRALLNAALEGVDTVFHLISTTVPGTSNDDPTFDIASNAVETVHLLELCVQRKIKKIVFLSSGGTVYGRPITLPVREDSSTDPECSYGITKLTIEKYLNLFNHLYGLDYAVVRPSNPYGTRQNPKAVQGAIAVFLGKIAGGHPIEIWGDGEVVRDYVHVDDLVEGIYRAATRATVSRIFNIGSGEGLSLNAVVELMRDVIGTQVTVRHTARRSFDIPSIYLDIDRARRELDWYPKTPPDRGIRDTWDFIRSFTAR